MLNFAGLLDICSPWHCLADYLEGIYLQYIIPKYRCNLELQEKELLYRKG